MVLLVDFLYAAILFALRSPDLLIGNDDVIYEYSQDELYLPIDIYKITVKFDRAS